MLEIMQVHVSYGHVNAVRGFTASVKPGRITLVLGPNGAGKTTSLRAIMGLIPAKSGAITFSGKQMLGLPVHRMVRAGVALVPEGRRVFASLTVEENLRIGAYVSSASAASETLAQVFEMFPILERRRGGAAGLLSGGEQQMLAFGRALMSRPSVILLDEPSMGLAPVIVDQVLATVRQIADLGLGVLMVEQNADAGLHVADDVIVMTRGEVVYSGPTADANAHASVVRALLGEAALTD